MTTTKRTITTTLASLLFAAPAFAADAPPPAPTLGPAPAGYSHINGQLVPVGDHNAYRLSSPRTNLAVNPLGWVVGSYGVSGSYGFTDNLALRADFTYYNEVGGGTQGVEAGLSVPIYFRRLYKGPFLEPGVMVRKIDDSPTVAGPNVLVGWHWIWDSGLNVALAFGVGRNLAKQNDHVPVFASGYLRFGYAF